MVWQEYIDTINHTKFHSLYSSWRDFIKATNSWKLLKYMSFNDPQRGPWGPRDSEDAAMRLCDGAKWADGTHLTEPSSRRSALAPKLIAQELDLLAHGLLLLFAVDLDVGYAIW